MDDLPTETEFKSADRFTCNKGEHSFLWKGSCFYSKCRTSMFFRCPSFNHANNATNKASGSYSKPGSVRTITSASSFSQSTHGFQPMFEKLERRRKRPFELYSESTISKSPFGLIGPQSSDSPNACNISWKLVVILLLLRQAV